MKKLDRPVVLTIGGLDPCAGAGILSDIKVFEQHRVYGMAVCSALTVQDEDEVFDVKWISTDEMIKQAIPVLNKYPIEVCKIGIISSLNVLIELVDFLHHQKNKIKIIWDPIIKSSSGFCFMDYSSIHWKNILSKIYLITPNYEELKQFNLKLNTGENTLKDWLSTSVLLKGGHHPDKRGIDQLFYDGKKEEILPFNKNIYQKHGSGCVLSSAIVAQIAKGESLLDASKLAKKYTEDFLNSHPGLLGYHH